MQALSFSAHIPLVCFGIAFPALALFVEWLYLRTGDPLYRTRYFWHEVIHMYLAAYIVAGFGTAAIYAWGSLWVTGDAATESRSSFRSPLRRSQQRRRSSSAIGRPARSPRISP